MHQSKRGGAETTIILDGIKLLLAVAICIVLYVSISNFLTSQTDYQVENNIQGFVNDIQALVTESKETITYTTTPLHLGNNYILAAFSKKQNIISDYCGVYDIEKITKPNDPACYDHACICIYKNTTRTQRILFF